MILQQMDMVHNILYYDLHRLREVWLTLQIFLQMSLFSFCTLIDNYSKAIFKIRSDILTIDTLGFVLRENEPKKDVIFSIFVTDQA